MADSTEKKTPDSNECVLEEKASETEHERTSLKSEDAKPKKLTLKLLKSEIDEIKNSIEVISKSLEEIKDEQHQLEELSLNSMEDVWEKLNRLSDSFQEIKEAINKIEEEAKNSSPQNPYATFEYASLYIEDEAKGILGPYRDLLERQGTSSRKRTFRGENSLEKILDDYGSSRWEVIEIRSNKYSADQYLLKRVNSSGLYS